MTNKSESIMNNETRKKASKLCDIIISELKHEEYVQDALRIARELKAILQNEKDGKLAIYCNDNQWHCYKCNGVVYNGDSNCSRCGQKLFWPDNEKKGGV